ncbi:MAG: hypothetical protein ACRETN_11675 [Nevskiales bacterium]
MATRLLILLLLLAWPVLALAVERMTLSAAAIEGNGWHARDVAIELDLAQTPNRKVGGAASIRIGALELPAPLGSLRSITLTCPQLETSAERLACRGAQLVGLGQGLSGKPAELDFEYVAATAALNAELRALRLYGGALNLQLAMDETGTRLRGQLQDIALAQADPLIVATGVAGLSASGGADVAFNLSIAPGPEPQMGGQLEFKLRDVTASEAEGKYASDKFTLSAQTEFERRKTGWDFKLDARASGGQIYIDPLFVEITTTPLELRTQGHYDASQSYLVLGQAVLQQAEILNANLQLTAQFKPAFKLQNLSAHIEQAQFPGAYPYIQPFLIGTAFDSLTTQGALSGQLRMQDGKPQAVHAELKQMHLHDTGERFSVDALDGVVHWSEADAVPESRLRWTGGSAYQVPFEAAELRVQTQGRDVALLAPWRQPFLGGALVIERLSAQALGKPEQKLGFDGKLEPIDLHALSSALGWPAFSGKLAGTLPQLTYSGEVLSLGGTLVAQVFDGAVTVEKFRLSSPFGRLPQLNGDLRLRNIDLAQATGAFSFGRIEGRVHGDVTQLQLLNWRPVAFDAKLYTPPDDRSRHRISQRAIENISSIGGGGAAGVISKGFLRFFEDFAYEHIGLSCVLANGICRMGGIEPKDGGYYIVKGALLPRVDVVGYAREVNWEVLLAQLRNATAGAGPVIK